MKKIVLVLVLAIIIAGMAGFGCASQSNEQNESEPAREVDLDFIAMSNKMVTGELYNMFDQADDYMGKIIRARGSYEAYYDEWGELYRHYLIYTDEAGCCALLLEFMWNGEHTYPDDYPAAKSIIEIVGVVNCYKSVDEYFDLTFPYLEVDAISILEGDDSQ